MASAGDDASLYEVLLKAATHHRAGRLAEAGALYRSVLATHPHNPDVHHNLGVLAMQEGRGLAVALPHFHQAWEGEPSHQQYGLSYLKALGLAKRSDEARRVHEDGLRRGFNWPPLAAMQPAGASAEPPQGWLAYARQRLEAGLLLEALEGFSHAITVQPKDLVARLGRARTLLALHRHEEAEPAFREVLVADPQWPAALCGYAATLAALDRTAEAETVYQRALAIDPTNMDAYSGLGTLFREAQRSADAEKLCRSVLAHNAALFDVHYHLGTLLTQAGRLDEARACYREVIALQPEHLEARSALLFIEYYTASRASSALLEQAKAFGALAQSRVTQACTSWNCSAQTDTLRVGLVSGDLYGHPVGYFLEGLIAHSNPANIEWIAYPTSTKTDALSERLRKHLRGWSSLVGLSDAEAVRRIHADGVHILIDLSGHTAYNRLPLFAWQPAPVTASWLGYFATTGLTQIDYLIADRSGVPEAFVSQFTERLLYLPDTRLCFTAPESAPEPLTLPAAERGFVTFGCFQTHPKITDQVLQLWSQILAQCPNSRIRIQNASLADTEGMHALRERLLQAGIDLARADLHGASPRARYLAECGEVDFLLDTFPYPGGTTTCEALWMGVPTLTLCGETMIARQGASLLSAAGLDDWIAHSEEEYLAMAVAHANNIESLAVLRRELRARMAASPLFDAARFAGNMEKILRQAWAETGRPRLNTA